MSERVESFVAGARAIARDLGASAEVTEERVAALIEKEFPVKRPTFIAGETLKMHEFLARFEREICAGVVPSFYDRTVHIVHTADQAITIAIAGPNASPLTPNP